MASAATTTKEVFPLTPFVSFRRPKNRKDNLVRARGAGATGAAGAASPTALCLRGTQGQLSPPPLPFAYGSTQGQLPRCPLLTAARRGSCPPRCPLLPGTRGGSRVPFATITISYTSFSIYFITQVKIYTVQIRKAKTFKFCERDA